MLPRDLATLKEHSYDDISHFHLQLAVDTRYGFWMMAKGPSPVNLSIFHLPRGITRVLPGKKIHPIFFLLSLDFFLLLIN